MALSLVNDAYAAAASVALPSFSAGDLAVVFAYRNASTTVPSLPAGWNDIASDAGANTNSRRIGYRILQAGDTTSGTWTNATAISVVIVRGQHPTTPIGNRGSGGSNTTTLTTPAVTLLDASGASWVLAFAGSKATNANSVTLSSTTSEGSTVGALNVASGRGVTSWASRAYSGAVNASGNRMDAVEVLAAPDPITGTGASAIRVPAANGSGSLGFLATGASAVRVPASVGAASLGFTGTGTAAIMAPTTSGSATLADTGFSLAGGSVIGATAAAGLALETFAASGGSQIRTAAGDGIARLGFALAGGSLVTVPAVNGSALATFAGAGGSTVAAPTTTGAGRLEFVAAGGSTIAHPTIQGAGPIDITGAGASAVRVPTASGLALLAFAGVGTSAVRTPASDGLALLDFIAAGSAALVAPRASGLARLGDGPVPTFQLAELALTVETGAVHGAVAASSAIALSVEPEPAMTIEVQS